MAQLDEHLKEKVEVLDEVGGVRPEPMGYDVRKPEHRKAAAEGVVEGRSSPRAGVVLADLGVPWRGGAVDGDAGREGEVGVADGVQSFESERGTQGRQRGQAPRRVLRSVAVPGRGVVLEREGGEAGVGLRRRRSGGEREGSAKAESALESRDVPERLAGPWCREELDLVLM